MISVWKLSVNPIQVLTPGIKLGHVVSKIKMLNRNGGRTRL